MIKLKTKKATGPAKLLCDTKLQSTCWCLLLSARSCPTLVVAGGIIYYPGLTGSGYSEDERNCYAKRQNREKDTIL